MHYRNGGHGFGNGRDAGRCFYSKLALLLDIPISQRSGPRKGIIFYHTGYRTGGFLCVYEGEALVLEASIPNTDQVCSGHPCWQRVSDRRVRYSNSLAGPGEVSRLRIKHSQRGITRVNLKGNSAPALPFVSPVSSQLIVLHDDREIDCVFSSLHDVRTNESDRAVLSGP